MNKELLKWGEDGEKAVMEVILESYDNTIVYALFESGNNSAPLMHCSKELDKIVAPDLFVFKGKQLCYIECKRKHQWVEWDGILQTGINTRNWHSYKKLHELTGVNFRLMFIHQDSGSLGDDGVYLVNINEAPFREWKGGGEVFWKLEQMKKWSYSDILLKKLKA